MAIAHCPKFKSKSEKLFLLPSASILLFELAYTPRFKECHTCCLVVPAKDKYCLPIVENFRRVIGVSKICVKFQHVSVTYILIDNLEDAMILFYSHL